MAPTKLVYGIGVRLNGTVLIGTLISVAKTSRSCQCTPLVSIPRFLLHGCSSQQSTAG
jgi:hypothetical protein